MDPQLIALYELKRQNFLLGYVQNPDRFSDSLAFAYYNRLEPIFHENIARETYEEDPFSSVYAIKGDFISALLKFVDENDQAGNLQAIEFYNLEDKFGGRSKRIEILHALEYARIDGRFGKKVWDAIVKNAPAEATMIDESFSPSNVEFR
ncbi:hypothetical protein [Brevundimonas sp. UBA2416]|uniref:hypothetical protein n=1 Tax=Brevundimonas sp. UBA2416 TaxID=1946124 RepID=UPI0025BB8019|nr:hypothetical protein [Brevundimonas sp. UBA2416]